MIVQRVSQDLAGLRRNLKLMNRQGKPSEISPHHARWIGHLLRLRTLQQADPGLGRHLSFEELEGLSMVEEVLTEGKEGRRCRRCKKMTASMFDCEHCGMRLT